MAFYKSSRKTVLCLWEGKQREYAMACKNNGVELPSVCIWCQKLRNYWRVINNCDFHKEKFINIKTTKTCKIRGVLVKLDRSIIFQVLETVLQRRRAPLYICQGPEHPWGCSASGNLWWLGDLQRHWALKGPSWSLGCFSRIPGKWSYYSFLGLDTISCLNITSRHQPSQSLPRDTYFHRILWVQSACRRRCDALQSRSHVWRACELGDRNQPRHRCMDNRVSLCWALRPAAGLPRLQRREYRCCTPPEDILHAAMLESIPSCLNRLRLFIFK